MARLRIYECPHCTGSFEVFHMQNDEPPPRFCQLCGYDTDEEPLVQPLSAPHIAKAVGKATDNIYRATEEGAQHRVTMAQEMFGLDTESANALKITDMRSGTRPGETAAMPVINPITQFMNANPNSGGFGQTAVSSAAHEAAVRTGYAPNAGAHAMADLRKTHAKFVQNAGHAGPTTSNAPALETQMPGYVPRARVI